MKNHIYKVNGIIKKQSKGGPIGLELTGAVSRAFMRRWDKLYMERAHQAGMKLKLYERYVDDSNQIAVTPPKGAKYNKETKRIDIDAEFNDERQEDERLATILKEIADDVMPCIQMEADWPSKNTDNILFFFVARIDLKSLRVITANRWLRQFCENKKSTSTTSTSSSRSQLDPPTLVRW